MAFDNIDELQLRLQQLEGKIYGGTSGEDILDLFEEKEELEGKLARAKSFISNTTDSDYPNLYLENTIYDQNKANLQKMISQQETELIHADNSFKSESYKEFLRKDISTKKKTIDKMMGKSVPLTKEFSNFYGEDISIKNKTHSLIDTHGIGRAYQRFLKDMETGKVSKIDSATGIAYDKNMLTPADIFKDARSALAGAVTNMSGKNDDIVPIIMARSNAFDLATITEAFTDPYSKQSRMVDMIRDGSVKLAGDPILVNKLSLYNANKLERLNDTEIEFFRMMEGNRLKFTPIGARAAMFPEGRATYVKNRITKGKNISAIGLSRLRGLDSAASFSGASNIIDESVTAYNEVFKYIANNFFGNVGAKVERVDRLFDEIFYGNPEDGAKRLTKFISRESIAQPIREKIIESIYGYKPSKRQIRAEYKSISEAVISWVRGERVFPNTKTIGTGSEPGKQYITGDFRTVMSRSAMRKKATQKFIPTGHDMRAFISARESQLIEKKFLLKEDKWSLWTGIFTKDTDEIKEVTQKILKEEPYAALGGGFKSANRTINEIIRASFMAESSLDIDEARDIFLASRAANYSQDSKKFASYARRTRSMGYDDFVSMSERFRTYRGRGDSLRNLQRLTLQGFRNMNSLESSAKSYGYDALISRIAKSLDRDLILKTTESDVGMDILDSVKGINLRQAAVELLYDQLSASGVSLKNVKSKRAELSKTTLHGMINPLLLRDRGTNRFAGRMLFDIPDRAAGQVGDFASEYLKIFKNNPGLFSSMMDVSGLNLMAQPMNKAGGFTKQNINMQLNDAKDFISKFIDPSSGKARQNMTSRDKVMYRMFIGQSGSQMIEDIDKYKQSLSEARPAINDIVANANRNNKLKRIMTNLSSIDKADLNRIDSTYSEMVDNMKLQVSLLGGDPNSKEYSDFIVDESARALNRIVMGSNMDNIFTAKLKMVLDENDLKVGNRLDVRRNTYSNLRDKRLIGFDLETHGTKYSQGDVYQFGATVRRKGKTTNFAVTLPFTFKEGGKSSALVGAYTGTQGPSKKDLRRLRSLNKYISGLDPDLAGTYFAAYNAEFDLKKLDSWINAVEGSADGLTADPYYQELKKFQKFVGRATRRGKTIDVFDVVKNVSINDKSFRTSTSLSQTKVASMLGIMFSNAHDAGADTKAMIDVLLELEKKHGNLFSYGAHKGNRFVGSVEAGAGFLGTMTKMYDIADEVAKRHGSSNYERRQFIKMIEKSARSTMTKAVRIVSEKSMFEHGRGANVGDSVMDMTKARRVEVAPESVGAIKEMLIDIASIDNKDSFRALLDRGFNSGVNKLYQKAYQLVEGDREVVSLMKYLPTRRTKTSSSQVIQEVVKRIRSGALTNTRQIKGAMPRIIFDLYLESIKPKKELRATQSFIKGSYTVMKGIGNSIMRRGIPTDAEVAENVRALRANKAYSYIYKTAGDIEDRLMAASRKYIEPITETIMKPINFFADKEYERFVSSKGFGKIDDLLSASGSADDMQKVLEHRARLHRNAFKYKHINTAFKGVKSGLGKVGRVIGLGGKLGLNILDAYQFADSVSMLFGKSVHLKGMRPVLIDSKEAARHAVMSGAYESEKDFNAQRIYGAFWTAKGIKMGGTGVNIFLRGAGKGLAKGALKGLGKKTISKFGIGAGLAMIPVVGPFLAGAYGIAMGISMAIDIVGLGQMFMGGQGFSTLDIFRTATAYKYDSLGREYTTREWSLWAKMRGHTAPGYADDSSSGIKLLGAAAAIAAFNAHGSMRTHNVSDIEDLMGATAKRALIKDQSSALLNSLEQVFKGGVETKDKKAFRSMLIDTQRRLKKEVATGLIPEFEGTSIRRQLVKINRMHKAGYEGGTVSAELVRTLADAKYYMMFDKYRGMSIKQRDSLRQVMFSEDLKPYLNEYKHALSMSVNYLTSGSEGKIADIFKDNNMLGEVASIIGKRGDKRIDSSSYEHMVDLVKSQLKAKTDKLQRVQNLATQGNVGYEANLLRKAYISSGFYKSDAVKQLKGTINLYDMTGEFGNPGEFKRFVSQYKNVKTAGKWLATSLWFTPVDKLAEAYYIGSLPEEDRDERQRAAAAKIMTFGPLQGFNVLTAGANKNSSIQTVMMNMDAVEGVKNPLVGIMMSFYFGQNNDIYSKSSRYKSGPFKDGGMLSGIKLATAEALNTAATTTLVVKGAEVAGDFHTSKLSKLDNPTVLLSYHKNRMHSFYSEGSNVKKLRSQIIKLKQSIVEGKVDGGESKKIIKYYDKMIADLDNLDYSKFKKAIDKDFAQMTDMIKTRYKDANEHILTSTFKENMDDSTKYMSSFYKSFTIRTRPEGMPSTTATIMTQTIMKGLGLSPRDNQAINAAFNLGSMAYMALASATIANANYGYDTYATNAYIDGLKALHYMEENIAGDIANIPLANLPMNLRKSLGSFLDERTRELNKSRTGKLLRLPGINKSQMFWQDVMGLGLSRGNKKLTTMQAATRAGYTREQVLKMIAQYRSEALMSPTKKVLSYSAEEGKLSKLGIDNKMRKKLGLDEYTLDKMEKLAQSGLISDPGTFVNKRALFSLQKKKVHGSLTFAEKKLYRELVGAYTGGVRQYEGYEKLFYKPRYGLEMFAKEIEINSIYSNAVNPSGSLDFASLLQDASIKEQQTFMNTNMWTPLQDDNTSLAVEGHKNFVVLSSLALSRDPDFRKRFENISKKYNVVTGTTGKGGMRDAINIASFLMHKKGDYKGAADISDRFWFGDANRAVEEARMFNLGSEYHDLWKSQMNDAEAMRKTLSDSEFYDFMVESSTYIASKDKALANFFVGSDDKMLKEVKRRMFFKFGEDKKSMRIMEDPVTGKVIFKPGGRKTRKRFVFDRRRNIFKNYSYSSGFNGAGFKPDSYHNKMVQAYLKIDENLLYTAQSYVISLDKDDVVPKEMKNAHIVIEQGNAEHSLAFNPETNEWHVQVRNIDPQLNYEEKNRFFTRHNYKKQLTAEAKTLVSMKTDLQELSKAVSRGSVNEEGEFEYVPGKSPLSKDKGHAAKMQRVFNRLKTEAKYVRDDNSRRTEMENSQAAVKLMIEKLRQIGGINKESKKLKKMANKYWLDFMSFDYYSKDSLEQLITTDISEISYNSLNKVVVY